MRQFFMGESQMNKKTLRLVESSVLIALAVALNFVRIYQMPLGGSVTLCSMLPVMLISYRYGVKWGLGSAFAYSVIHLLISMFAYGELLSWGLSAQAIVGSMFLDYFLAFTSLGLAGIFGTKFWQYISGMCLAVAVRYVLHVISGVVIFGTSLPKGFTNPLLYSLVYNAFLLPDLIICLVGGIALYAPLRKYIRLSEKVK